MARQTIKRVQGDLITEQTQRATEEFVYRVVPAWVNDGVLLESVSLVNGAVQVDHKLNRVPLGFIVFDIDANTNVWATAKTSLSITLNATATATAKVWVF